MNKGIVYLLHFARPWNGVTGHAQHYLGFTTGLDQRLKRHERGTAGSAITRIAFRQGIGFVLVRTWPGTLATEHELKRQGAKSLCPVCSEIRE